MKLEIDDPSTVDPTTMSMLERVIRKAGVSLEPEHFMAVVSTAFRQAQRTANPSLDMPSKFRNSPSYGSFLRSLKLAEAELKRPLSVLIVGCGAGYAGCSPDYAADVVRDVLSSVRDIHKVELSFRLLQNVNPSQTYDLVVTHSLAHFVLDLKLVFRYLASRVATGGGLVLGHEPNSAFWSDHRTVRLCELHRRTRPRRYAARVWRYLTQPKPPSVFHLTNSVLKKDHRFLADLTPAVVTAIVDPHFPSGYSFRLGSRGLDPEGIRASYLPEFSLRGVETCEYQGIDESEAAQSGLPGRIFSALYLRASAL